MRSPAVVLAVLALVACTEPEPPPTAAVYAMGDDPGCPGWKCSGNSPIMGAWGPFTDFDLTGVQENTAHLKVDGLWKAGQRYKPHISGAQLYATKGFAMLVGPMLAGSYLRITTPDPAVVYELEITVVNMGTVHYWVGPSTGLVTYELNYTGVGIKDTPLCNNPPGSTSGDGGTWLAPLEAILFTGDRYALDKKIFASTYDESDGWMTIGCAGSAIAKLMLNRFTTAGSIGTYGGPPMPGDYLTTRAERQDVLNMYTGNVCGTGKAFTVPDTPITWESRNGWHALTPLTTYESVWGSGRALCLDVWRLEDSHPGILDDIEAECALPPPCSTASWFPAWQLRGSVRSANP